MFGLDESSMGSDERLGTKPPAPRQHNDFGVKGGEGMGVRCGKSYGEVELTSHVCFVIYLAN